MSGIRHNLPIFKEKRYRWFMHTVDTALILDSNPKVTFRLRCIQLLERCGWKAVKTAFPGVSRASVYRWRRVYIQNGRKINSLVPRSTRPHKLRQMVVPKGVLGFIKEIREKYPHLSKYKIKPFLDVWCKEQGHKTYSVSWIGKVISRNSFFFNTRKPVRKRRKKPRSGYRIHHCPSPTKVKLGYLQLDGITIYWNGKKHTFLSALEIKTRTAWVKRVPTLSSLQAKLFLQEIMKGVNYHFHTIHTDNGSEFKAVFDAAVQELKLLHLWSPPKTPKVHSNVERFNKTVQEEFINYHLDTANTYPDEFTRLLEEWINWYNNKRPHHSLGLTTPHQYLLQLQGEKNSQSLKCP
jgi:transposase